MSMDDRRRLMDDRLFAYCIGLAVVSAIDESAAPALGVRDGVVYLVMVACLFGLNIIEATVGAGAGPGLLGESLPQSVLFAGLSLTWGVVLAVAPDSLVGVVRFGPVVLFAAWVGYRMWTRRCTRSRDPSEA